MSCPMPEIGSCISLISKADIRYEGLLFTVDPDRCTIALARVKSYGTEDRETQFPIAPQNQCYDYILFRGSDIKDIRVINNNPVPNDPAIMQMHLPPQQQLPPMQNKLGQPGFQPQPGFMMPQMGPGPMSGPPPGHQPLAQPYGSFGGINNLGASVLDLIGGGGGTGGSRSTTPSNLLSRKSPTVDMGVQTNQQQQQQNQSGAQQNNSRDANRSGGDGGNMDRTNNQRNRNNNQRNNNMQRERRDSAKNDGGQMKDGFNKNLQRQGNQNNQNRGWNNNRGNNQNQSNNMRGRPRGRGGIPQQGLNRGKNLLKFENDYDFEQANNKFEELRSQLSKLKVGDEVKPEQLNSETTDKKDDSGNETGAGEHEQEEDEVVCYDKAKSFFDTISCEAIERAKGKQQRTDWRQERKLNTETFGVGSTRRGGYNRRGGYYNRGPNNYRGNNQYRNNYRGRSGNRNNQPNGLSHNNGGNRNNGNSNNNQQQPQPQQPRLQSPQAQQPAAIEVGAGK
ncbi:protein LSM14 homolog B isoform X4 [Wyeomyia smithii]|uniref:protein LSM14 homolog B isoform X4 n=1 Tax=Wyeomyia smithii TaxID=174621 RepID=UPI002468192A|nr:protein LSM14 homolog B isoform X4 [Wyeomyia smithii]